MGRWSFVFLFGLAACAELKDRPPGADEDTPAPAPASSSNRAAAPQTEATTTTTTGQSDAAVTVISTGVDAGSAVTPEGIDAPEVLCTAICGNRARCKQAGLATCTATCHATYSRTAQHFRARYVQFVNQCLSTLDCSESQDTCLGAWSAIELDASADPLVVACQTEMYACPSLQMDCYGFLAYDDPTRALVKPCFDVACGQVASCVTAATTAPVP